MQMMEQNFRAQMAQAEQKMGGAVDQLMNTPQSLAQVDENGGWWSTATSTTVK